MTSLWPPTCPSDWGHPREGDLRRGAAAAPLFTHSLGSALSGEHVGNLSLPCHSSQSAGGVKQLLLPPSCPDQGHCWSLGGVEQEKCIGICSCAIHTCSGKTSLLERGSSLSQMQHVSYRRHHMCACQFLVCGWKCNDCPYS